MKQQQQVHDRLKRLEQINANVNRARHKYSGKKVRDYENLQQIEEILYGVGMRSPPQYHSQKKYHPALREQDQNIQDNSNSQPKKIGCIVSSKNGVFKKSKPKVLDSVVLTDAFQTVRSIKVTSHQLEEIKREKSAEKALIAQKIYEINERLSTDVGEPQQQPDGINDTLQREKKQLEDEIARLHSQLTTYKRHRPLTPMVKSKAQLNEDRQTFEQQWQQLEDEEVQLLPTSLLSEMFDLWDNCDEEPVQTESIDTNMIDNLAKEVEELMVTHNLNVEQQPITADRRYHYTPPLDTIEEEASMEVSVLY